MNRKIVIKILIDDRLLMIFGVENGTMMSYQF